MRDDEVSFEQDYGNVYQARRVARIERWLLVVLTDRDQFLNIRQGLLPGGRG